MRLQALFLAAALAAPLQATTLRGVAPEPASAPGAPPGTIASPGAGLDLSVSGTPLAPSLNSTALPETLSPAAPPSAPAAAEAAPSAIVAPPALVPIQASPAVAPGVSDTEAPPSVAPEAHQAVEALAKDERMEAVREGKDAPQALASFFDLSAAKPGKGGGVLVWQQPASIQRSGLVPGMKAGSAAELALRVTEETLKDRMLVKLFLAQRLNFSSENGNGNYFALMELFGRLGPRISGLWTRSAEVIAELMKPQRGTLRAGPPDKIEPLQGSLFSLLWREAAAAKTAEHVPEVARRSEALYKRFFPDFFREVRFEVAVHGHSSIGGWHTHMNRASHLITLAVDRPVGAEHEALPGPSNFISVEDRVPGEPLQGRIPLLLIYFHEYAHAIFDDAALPADQRALRPENSKDTAYDAMTEGFAVTMELLAADKMAAAAEELGLSERDVADLRRWKRLRITHLRAFPNHYTTGTLYFWHKIYREEGEAGMLRFLHSLDGPRLRRIALDDPEFLAVRGKPALFKKYLAVP